MPVNEIHVDDIGTIFEITMNDESGVVDLTGATTTEFLFKKPDDAGTLLTKIAVVDGDPTSGIMRYTMLAGDLDVKGCWQIQVNLALPGGAWKSDIGTFHVYENLS